MNGAFATKSPSGANSAHEKSSLSLMFVLIDVCCNERPIASATLMKRLAKRVKRMGSGLLTSFIAVMMGNGVCGRWSLRVRSLLN